MLLLLLLFLNPAIHSSKRAMQYLSLRRAPSGQPQYFPLPQVPN